MNITEKCSSSIWVPYARTNYICDLEKGHAGNHHQANNEWDDDKIVVHSYAIATKPKCPIKY